MKTLCLGLVVLAFTPACLGDDPDHMSPVDTGGVQSPKVYSGIGSTLPDALHARLLDGIGTKVGAPNPQPPSFHVELTRDSAVTVAAPELCDSCTITLVNEGTPENLVTNTVTVWDDAATVEICQIQLTLTVDAKRFIRADNCGSLGFDDGGALDVRYTAN